MKINLNERACALVATLDNTAAELAGIRRTRIVDSGTVLDFGVEAPGSLTAGVLLARLCMADLARISLVPGLIDGTGFTHVQVETDHPLEACLLSQYAGWRVSVGEYFGMGSGPIRTVAAREELFEKLDAGEEATSATGVLEASVLPNAEVFDYLS